MAKVQAAVPADATAVDVNALDQVMVASSGDALAMAVAGGKVEAAVVVTDTSEAKEVVEMNGTTIVRW